MQNVRMNKYLLSQKLRQNKEKHVEEYNEARYNYRTALRQDLKLKLDALERGDEVEHFIDLPKPQSHESDYQRAIEMLDVELRQEVELSQTDFRRYVQDEWEWKAGFTATSELYRSDR